MHDENKRRVEKLISAIELVPFIILDFQQVLKYIRIFCHCDRILLHAFEIQVWIEE